MSFVSDDSFETRFSKQKHIVVDFIIELFVDVVLAVFWVTWFFIGESLDSHVLAIDYNSFIERLSGDNILHTTDKLKLVIVDLFDVADCGCAKSILLIVLLKECANNFCKFAVLIDVL